MKSEIEINGVIMISPAEVERITGVKISTLGVYEKKGLIQPSARTEQGELQYRWYDDRTIIRLNIIRILVGLDYPLKKIKEILDAPNFDTVALLDQIIVELKKKRSWVQAQIEYAQQIKLFGLEAVGMGVFSGQNASKQFSQIQESASSFEDFDEEHFDINEGIQQILEEIFSPHETISLVDPYSQEVQDIVQKLIDISDDQEQPADTSDICYFLLLLFPMMVGSGTAAAYIDKNYGKGSSLILAKAIIYRLLIELEQIVKPIMSEYAAINDKKARAKFLKRKQMLLRTWLVESELYKENDIYCF